MPVNLPLSRGRRPDGRMGCVPTTKSSRILHRLIALGPATRGELGGELDMSSATVTRLVVPLIKRGIIRVLDDDGSDYRIGKPAYRLGIVPSCATFIGLKVTDSKSFGVVVDMSGAVLRRGESSLGCDSPEDVVSILADQISSLSEGLGVVGVGVGVGGRVFDGRIVSSGILGWKGVPFQKLLESRCAVAVTVSNDVNAFAQAESWWGGGRGKRSFVLVSVGTGIGACVINQGTVFEGEHGSAGMVGHLKVDDFGPRCESGHVGCVRGYASSTCILRQLKEHYGIDESYEDFIANAVRGHAPEHDMACHAIDAIARVVSAAIAFVDPDAVLISGEGVGLLLAFEQQLRRQIDAYRHWNGPAVEIELREMEFSSWAQGAAAAAMERWTQVHLSRA